MRLLLPVLAAVGAGVVVVVTYFQVRFPDAEPPRKAYLSMTPSADLPSQIQSLVRRLGSNDAAERAQAAVELHNLGKANLPALPYLLRVLEDRTPVRIGSAPRTKSSAGFFTCPGALAAAALADSEDVAVVALMRAMTQRKNDDIRRSALEGAGCSNDRRLIAALAEALASQEAIVRESAQVGLKRAGVRAIEPLAECLRGDNWRARNSAAEILARLGDRATLQVLLRATQDNSADVRVAAEYGLSQVRDAACISLLVEMLADPAVREPASRVLLHLDHPQRTWLLVEALQDRSNSDLRLGAAHALVLVKDPSAADALRKAQNDSHPEVRRKATEALAALQIPQ